MPSDEIEKTFRTNIFAMFYLCKAALPQMKEGGAIINTASIQAYKTLKEFLAYAASKGAIVNFTKALSEETIEKGIRVNAFAPGPVWTPLIPSTMPPEQVENCGKDSPMKRPAKPSELARPRMFFSLPTRRVISERRNSRSNGWQTADVIFGLTVKLIKR